MLELQLKYSTGLEECKCPTQWDELPFSKWLDLINNDNGDWFRRISILTGISEDNLKQVGIETFAMLMNASKFLSTSQQFLEGEFKKEIPKEYQRIDIAQIESGFYFQIKTELKRVADLGCDKMNAAPKIIQLLTTKRNKEGGLLPGWDIMDEPVTNCLHVAGFFLNKYGDS